MQSLSSTTRERLPVLALAITLATFALVAIDLILVSWNQAAVSIEPGELLACLPKLLVALPTAAGALVLIGGALVWVFELLTPSRWARRTWVLLLMTLPLLIMVPPLFDGRAISASSWRYPGMAAACAAALLFVAVVQWVVGRAEKFVRGRGPAVLGSFVVSAAAVALCGQVTTRMLVGLYTGFHQGLSLVALFILTGAFYLGLRLVERPQRPRLTIFVLLATAVFAVPLGMRLSRGAVFARTLLVDHAPFSGVILGPLSVLENRAWSLARPRGVGALDPEAVFPRVQFQTSSPRRSVLLITVDALRGDVIGTPGGTEPSSMPRLQRMLGEHLYFARAYSPGNNTSVSIPALSLGYIPTPGETADIEHLLPVALKDWGYHSEFYFPAHEDATFRNVRAFTDKGFHFDLYHPEYRPAAEILAAVERRLAGFDSEQPFFFWIHLSDVHSPFYLRTEPHRRALAATYREEVARLDDVLAPFLERITLRHPELVWAVSSDHGESLGERGVKLHGSNLYDEQVRVPLVIGGPAAPPGIVSAPVSLTDLGATLLSMAGAEVPASVATLPLAQAPQSSVAPVFMRGNTRLCGLVEGPWKIIADNARGALYLFHLPSDPTESHNRIVEDLDRSRRLLDALYQRCPYDRIPL